MVLTNNFHVVNIPQSICYLDTTRDAENSKAWRYGEREEWKVEKINDNLKTMKMN